MAKTVKCRVEKLKGKFIVIDNEGTPLLEVNSFNEAVKFINKITSPKAMRPSYEF